MNEYMMYVINTAFSVIIHSLSRIYVSPALCATFSKIQSMPNAQITP